MKKIILFVSVLACSSAFAGEYQKMFTCAKTLKEEAQISDAGVAKDYIVMPTKLGPNEGVNLFTAEAIYFCKLPKNFVAKNIDEKMYKMNLSVAKHKPIYVSYLKSATEAPAIEFIGNDQNLDFAFNRAELAVIKPATCVTSTGDARSEKNLADFLRKQIAQVHERHEAQTLESPGAVTSLKVCQKSFLLKSIADNELRKFEVRVPAAAE